MANSASSTQTKPAQVERASDVPGKSAPPGTIGSVGPPGKAAKLANPNNVAKPVKIAKPTPVQNNLEDSEQKAQEALKKSLDSFDRFFTVLAFAASGLFIVIAWFWLVNIAPVRNYQMYRCLHLNRIGAMPDSVTDGPLLVPSVIASELAKGANSQRHCDVSPDPSLILGRKPVWRFTLRGNDWLSGIFKSDSGFIEISARKLGAPEMHPVGFLIGENSPLWCLLLGWLPFSSIIERSYQKDVEGKWSLVFVCPWFRLTWLGTLIPTSGFLVRVSPNGIPQILSLEKAKKLYPELPLFPKAIAERYSRAYALWCGGLRDRFLRRARPLSFFEYKPDKKISSARIELFDGIGLQYTVLLGLPKKQGGALHSLVLFDIRTGEPRLFEGRLDCVIYGPIDAVCAVCSEFGKSNHSYGAPKLFCSGGRFYWIVTVLGFPRDQELGNEDNLSLIGHRIVDAATNCVVNLPGGVSALLSDELVLSSLYLL
jgi:hypothetical protein